jgi:indolepyruvate ferredoxin oxidoreductase
MRSLAAMRRLRGTPFDLFGRTALRKVERALPAEFEAAVRALLTDAKSSNDSNRVTALVSLGRLPDMVRGYEHVKQGNIERYEAAMADLLASTGSPTAFGRYPRQ